MLLQIQLMVDSGLLMLIWLVQTIIYPSFHHINKEVFKTWHISYTRAISSIVSPLMLLQAGLELYQASAGGPRWWRILLIVAIFYTTFVFSVPCHKELQSNGKKTAVIERLVQTNWLRTLLWTLLFLQTIWHALNIQE